MDWKRIVNRLLFPPLIAVILLTPVATILLILALAVLRPESVPAVFSYVISAYSLTIVLCRIPRAVRCYNAFRSHNRFIKRWQSDPRLRISVSLHRALLFNVSYGILQLGLGLWHGSFWFFSIGAYCICLAAMRFFLLLHARRYAPGTQMHKELRKYRACGRILLLLNIALSLIIFFMVYWGKSFSHHMVTAIAMAAYTFTALPIAIVHTVSYRKYNSPVFSASKAIGMASALVSVLMLEATMLTAFDDGGMTAIQKKLLLGATGGTISALIIATALYMITVGTRRLNTLKSEVKNGTEQ